MSAATAPSAAAKQRRTQAERREEAERSILDAAVRLVAEKGLDGFTLADAGEAAGYSRGLPAHYFGSKPDLLAAAARYIREWFFARLEARVGGHRRGLANLISGIDVYFDACRDDRTMLRALHTVLSGALHNPAIADTVVKLNRDAVKSVEVALRAGIANGEIRRSIDVDAWSVLILSSMRGVVTQCLIDPDPLDVSSLRNTFVTALKRNLTT